MFPSDLEMGTGKKVASWGLIRDGSAGVEAVVAVRAAAGRCGDCRFPGSQAASRAHPRVYAGLLVCLGNCLHSRCQVTATLPTVGQGETERKKKGGGRQRQRQRQRQRACEGGQQAHASTHTHAYTCPFFPSPSSFLIPPSLPHSLTPSLTWAEQRWLRHPWQQLFF